ncbi:MAG: hypothetical protein ACE5QV_05785, partial [Fidelibacterota bacterium]
MKIYRPLAICTLIFLVFSWGVSQEKRKIRKEGSYFLEETEYSFKVKKGGDLRLSTVLGALEFDSWDRNEVKVVVVKKIDVFSEEEAEEAFDRFRVKTDTKGNDVMVNAKF